MQRAQSRRSDTSEAELDGIGKKCCFVKLVIN